MTKRTRARVVATIREHLINMPWRLKDDGNHWVVYFQAIPSAIGGDVPVSELRTYAWPKSNPDARGIARECWADKNANYLADKLSELDE